MRLATLIRIFRAFKGYQLKILAAEIGISNRELAAIENGSTPNGATMAKVLIWALSSEVISVPVSPAPATEAEIVSPGDK